MPPISPLKSGDQHSWYPANYDADVRDHCQDDNERADKRREVQTEKSQKAANENAIDEANQQLAAKISDDVAVNLRHGLGDFVFKRRRTQRKVIFPSFLNPRPLL